MDSKTVIKIIFIYHILYTLFFSNVFGQNVHLKIEGIDSITKNYLLQKKQIATFENLKSLKQEITHIKQKLFNIGYFNLTATALKKTNDSTHQFSLQLHKQFRKITILYPNHFTKHNKHLIFTPQTIFNEKSFTCTVLELQQNLNNIIQHLSNSGKTFSSLLLQNIQVKGDAVFAELHVNASKKNSITDIIIKGYDKFPKKFIKNYLKLKPKQILNITEIERKSTYLNNLLFVSELKKPQILFSKDSTTVYLYLKKIKSNTFDGYLGFKSNTETSKLELNGNINLKLINNLNQGEELHLKYLSTADEQKKINIKTKIPFLFNTPFSIEAELAIFKKDSTFSTNQQYIQLKYPIHQNINIGSGTRFTKSISLDNTLNSVQDFSKNEYLLNFEHIITQENSFFKTKNKTILELSISKRKTKIQDTPQQSIYLNSAHILNLNFKNSVYIKNESYYLISGEVLDNEAHFIGGINSIRGFQENSIPSHLYSYINTEFRIQLNNTLYTHTVIDYGISKNKDGFDNLFGFGFGFGLKSKNNLLRFVFANNKTNSEKIKFSNSQIHLSLNTSF